MRAEVTTESLAAQRLPIRVEGSTESGVILRVSPGESRRRIGRDQRGTGRVLLKGSLTESTRRTRLHQKGALIVPGH